MLTPDRNRYIYVCIIVTIYVTSMMDIIATMISSVVTFEIGVMVVVGVYKSDTGSMVGHVLYN